jgi:hypothetical protein
MKALIEWFKDFLGIGLKFKEEAPVEPVVEEKLTPPQPPKAQPKVTKASLNKLTKAQLEARAEELGVILKKGLKKADLVNELFKAEKK